MKLPTINYTFFSTRCCGIDMGWIDISRSPRGKQKHYMEAFKLYPHQIKGMS